LIFSTGGHIIQSVHDFQLNQRKELIMAKRVSASQQRRNSLNASRMLARSHISKKSMDRMGRQLYNFDFRKEIENFEKTLDSKVVKALYERLEAEKRSPIEDAYLARLRKVTNFGRDRKAIRRLNKRLPKEDRKKLLKLAKKPRKETGLDCSGIIAAHRKVMGSGILQESFRKLDEGMEKQPSPPSDEKIEKLKKKLKS
jgi:hypothetical protein